MAKILVEPPVDEAIEVPGEPIEDAKSVLSRLAAVPGVALAVLVDREGFLIESAGDMVLEAEAAGALAGCLAEASEAIGRELSQGTLVGLIAEYEAGLILVNMAGSGAMLATVLSDPAALVGARDDVKKTLSDLLKVA
jgi:predicted regulator of Ras-like GTPase activity (Roadblock/LC7/MglB family)